MKYLLTQLNKEIKIGGTTQIMTVIITAVGLIGSLIFIIYMGIKETNARYESKLESHEESINVLKQDMALLKMQSQQMLETQKAMMVLLKK